VSDIVIILLTFISTRIAFLYLGTHPEDVVWLWC